MQLQLQEYKKLVRLQEKILEDHKIKEKEKL